MRGWRGGEESPREGAVVTGKGQTVGPVRAHNRTGTGTGRVASRVKDDGPREGHTAATPGERRPPGDVAAAARQHMYIQATNRRRRGGRPPDHRPQPPPWAAATHLAAAAPAARRRAAHGWQGEGPSRAMQAAAAHLSVSPPHPEATMGAPRQPHAPYHRPPTTLPSHPDRLPNLPAPPVSRHRSWPSAPTLPPHGPAVGLPAHPTPPPTDANGAGVVVCHHPPPPPQPTQPTPLHNIHCPARSHHRHSPLPPTPDPPRGWRHDTPLGGEPPPRRPPPAPPEGNVGQRQACRLVPILVVSVCGAKRARPSPAGTARHPPPVTRPPHARRLGRAGPVTAAAAANAAPPPRQLWGSADITAA